MTVFKVSDTRLFPGKPITAQIVQEFDETQEHIAKRTSDRANDITAIGSAGKFVNPKTDNGFYPIAETDFQAGFSHTTNEPLFGTTVLTGSIIQLKVGYYDVISYASYNTTDVYVNAGFYNVNDDGSINGVDGLDHTFHYNNDHYEGGSSDKKFFISSERLSVDNIFYNQNQKPQGVYLGGKYRVGVRAVGLSNVTVKCSGYVQICQRKEISTCPIGCERGQLDEDTGDIEIDTSHAVNTLSTTETAGRTLEPIKIYWS